MFRKHLPPFIIVLCMMFSLSLPAQQLPRIAVLPFNPVGVSMADAEVLTSLFETAMVNTRAFEVIEQSQAGNILEAQAQSLSGCTDESCAVEIGKLLAAENIILGKVSKLGEMFIVTAKIIDVTTGKNIRADSVQGGRIEEMTEQVNILAYKLAGLTYGGGPAAAAQAPAASSFGEVFVDSDPGGAEIFMNGMSRGITPALIKQVPAGRILIEVRKDVLYASREVEVIADGLVEVLIPLQAAAGRLFITTDDRDLEVVIDGTDMGTVSGGLFKDIPAGDHELEVKGEDRYWKQVFRIEPGKTTELEVYPRILGSLTWDLPEKAVASFTGELVSAEFSGQGEDRLPSDTYEVTVSGPYYLDYTGTVRISPDAPAVFAPNLEFADTEEARAFLAGMKVEELQEQRKALVKQIRALQPRSFTRTLGWISTGIGGAGLLTAATGLVIGFAARNAYDGSTAVYDLARSWNTVEVCNTLVHASLWPGLAFGAAAPFLFMIPTNEDPETALQRELLEVQLENLDNEIASLKEATQ